MIIYKKKDYDITKLGNNYQKDKTSFTVFAPTYKRLFLLLENERHEMRRNGLLFEIEIKGDLELKHYHYETDNGISFKDPFSYLSLNDESVILDKDKFIKDKVKVKKHKKTLIYEANIRDFSSDKNYKGKYKKKFLSLTEDNLLLSDKPIGLNYIKSLGISHLQLMPIFDFDNDKSDYNWGYNPISYNSLKPDYIADTDDPYAYINEFRRTVNVLHENNIKVVLDVVFNHVYNARKNDLQKMVPDLFFRFKKDGSLAEGTMCGNEIRSEEAFVADYFSLMALRYLELFDIDGLRFDLMGILDVDFINKVDKLLKKKKKDFIIYGEGWHMGDVLEDELRASMNNAEKIKDVAMFNDFFRETIIHYVSGNISIIEDVKKALNGIHDYLSYSQSINYVECHDGYTFIDRMNKYLEDEWLNESRARLALALVMISRGIPFIHMGEEFFRSKHGLRNSYNSGDEINKIDWSLCVKNSDDVEYFKKLIDIYNKYDFSKVKSFDDYYGALICRVDDLMIIINPGEDDGYYYDGSSYEVLLDGRGYGEYFTENILISSCCLVICKNLL